MDKEYGPEKPPVKPSRWVSVTDNWIARAIKQELFDQGSGRVRWLSQVFKITLVAWAIVATYGFFQNDIYVETGFAEKKDGVTNILYVKAKKIHKPSTNNYILTYGLTTKGNSIALQKRMVNIFVGDVYLGATITTHKFQGTTAGVLVSLAF